MTLKITQAAKKWSTNDHHPSMEMGSQRRIITELGFGIAIEKCLP